MLSSVVTDNTIAGETPLSTPTLASAVIPPVAPAVPRHDLLQCVIGCETKWDCLTALAHTLADTFPGAGLVYFERDDQHRLMDPQQLPVAAAPSCRTTELLELKIAAEAVCANGKQLWRKLANEGKYALVTPVLLDESLAEAICILPGDATDGGTVVELIGLWLAAHLTLWQAYKRTDRLGQDAANQNRLMSLLTQLTGAPDLTQAGHYLVAGLQQWFRAERVALGLANGKGAYRLLAVSSQTRVDLRSEYATAIEHSLNETMEHQDVVSWPTNTPRTFRRLVTLAACDRASGVNLRNSRGDNIGAIIVLSNDVQAPPEQLRVQLAANQTILSNTLDVLRQAHNSMVGRGLLALSRIPASTRRLVFVAVLAIVGAMFLPVPHGISCSCSMEPVTRRIVAAPFTGTLLKTLVEPGNVVQAGDVLAQMDEREARWELSGLEAEYHRARKRHDSALASRAGGQAQLAHLEMEQLQARMNSLKYRTENLTIKSPLNGLVVRGDLKRSEGVPLSVGQTLFEVAPLAEMITEIAIPERDIGYVRDGQSVGLQLEAFRGRTWNGTLTKIHPRAELRDNQSVFVGEMRLSNIDSLLRPGMKGQARISAPWRALGWILFHRPFEALRGFTGW